MKCPLPDERDTCAECNDFKSLDDAVDTLAYGVCKKSGRAVYKDDEKKEEECGDD